ncbi:hypothetical protein ON010_g10853 [Phytophthora cinnamomi]|nr:hypothetical protein ON010_g10853 [Phytophthora cinnamomi]
MKIACSKLVNDLRGLIMQGNAGAFTGVNPHNRFYAAEVSDGQWLSSTGVKVEELATKQFSHVSGLLREELDLNSRVESVFRSIGKDQVHALVVAQPWNASSVFSHFTVEERQYIIKKKREDIFEEVDAAKVNVVLAKTCDETWLHGEAPQIRELAYADSRIISELRQQTMDPGEKLTSLFECADEVEIHVLVLTPESTSSEVVAVGRWLPREMKTFHTDNVGIEDDSDKK